MAWIVCIGVGVEDVEDQPVGGLGATELVQIRLQLFGLTIQIDGLAKKSALNQKIRLRLA